MKLAVESSSRGMDAANKWFDAVESGDDDATRRLHQEVVGYERTYWGFYGIQTAKIESDKLDPEEAELQLKWYKAQLHTSARHIGELVRVSYGLEESGQNIHEINLAAYKGLMIGMLVFEVLTESIDPPGLWAAAKTVTHT